MSVDKDVIQKVKVRLEDIRISGNGQRYTQGELIDRTDHSFQFISSDSIDHKGVNSGKEFVVDTYRTGSSPEEVWVSPSGDDTAEGSKNDPFKTLTKARSHLIDRVDSNVLKILNILPGTYNEQLIINEDNFIVQGHGSNREIILEGDSNTGPPLVIVNATDTGWSNFVSDGGIDWTEGASFSWTGADVVGREAIYTMNNVTVKNIGLKVTESTMNGHDLSLVKVNFPKDEPDYDIAAHDVIAHTLEDIYTGHSTDIAYFKNCRTDSIKSDIDSKCVFDNCLGISYKVGSGFGLAGKIVSRYDDSSKETEGVAFLDFNLPFENLDININGLEVYQPTDASIINQFLNTRGNDIFSKENIVIRGYTELQDSNNNSNFDELRVRKTKDITIEDNAVVKCSVIECRDLTCTTLQTVESDAIRVARDVAISNGTVTFKEGHIVGDLTVNNGATVTLRDVKIQGNVTSDGASTTVDLIGCTVEGTKSTVNSGTINTSFSNSNFDYLNQDLITHGQKTIHLPLDTGTRPSAGDTLSSWNDDYTAINFEKTGTPSNGIWRFHTQPPPGYTGGDIIFRVFYSLNNSGGAGETTKWNVGADWASTGFDFQTPSTYQNSYSITNDEENNEYDIIHTFDVTIPEADVDVSKEILFMELMRETEDATNDTYPEDVYVHSVALVYTGWGLVQSASAP